MPEYLATNPVPAYKKDLRLRVDSGTPAYTDAEVEQLLAAIKSDDEQEHVYRVLVRALVATGLRAGEAIALDRRDVNLAGKTLRVRHTYHPQHGLQAPKDRDERTVYLTPEAEAVFTDWIRQTGAHAEGVVFPAPRSRSYINAYFLRKVVDAAITDAALAKVDERTGGPRKPLHSLRATFARRQLEAGRHPQWVEAQLGHSSLTLTIGVYGAWSDEAMRAEAAKDQAETEAAAS
jgi:integrase